MGVWPGSNCYAEAQHILEVLVLKPPMTEAPIWPMLRPMPAKRRSVIREQHVKLFRNGRNQAVRIPREFELPGNDAIIRKEGERLIIETVPPKSLLAVLDRLSPIDEQFPPIAELAGSHQA